MAIRVKPVFEPFANRAGTFDPAKYVLGAKSRASQRIADDMLQYALGQIQGRSFLVAGHRGSGKTTAVDNAIDDLRQRLAGERRLLRVADVRLHGPDLLARKDKPGEDVALADTRQMLRQVTLALYRRIADIFAERYRERLLASGVARDEGAEVAAQLLLDLDGAPEASLLREYWERAGALPGGVLYPGDALRPERGFDELVALACAAQAYQFVLGELTVTEKGSDSAKYEQKTEVKLAADLKQAANGLFACLAGGAAGAAALQSTHSALAATGLGLVTMGLSAAVLNWSVSRSRDKSVTREVTFLPDTKVESLDRMLPLLVERVRACGIVPVFIVDELDKVPNLVKRIEDLVRHLKHFVTERAFFCFLTDRDFYEQVARLSTDQPYPKEHTYFSDRLLLYFAPGELHGYLTEALATENAEDKQAAEVLRYILLHRARAHAFDLRQRLSTFQDESEHVKLAYFQILDTRAYRFDVTVQVAVELVLADTLIQDQLESNPEFMLLACDALYYPSRTWAAGDTTIDLSAETFQEYLMRRLGVAELRGTEPRTLLLAVGRLVDLLADPLRLKSEAHGSKRFPSSVIETLFPEPLVMRAGEDLRWCYDVFGRSLAPLDPSLGHAEDPEPPSVEPPAPETAEPQPTDPPAPAEEELASSTPAAPAPPPPAPEAPQLSPARAAASAVTSKVAAMVAAVMPQAAPEAPPDFAAAIKDIEARAAYVREATEDFFNLKLLAVEYRLIGITPTWDGVQLAVQRLKRHLDQQAQYAELAQDAKLVVEYADMLRQRWLGILDALLLGALVGKLGAGGDRWERWRSGFESLARALDFETATGADVDRRLALLFAQGLAARLADPKLELLEPGETQLPAVLQHTGLKRALASIDQMTMQELAATRDGAVGVFWTTWRKRFGDALAGIQTFEPEWSDLVCRVVDYGPAALLALDLQQVTVRMWSELTLSALQGRATPHWMLGPALSYLGFRSALGREPPLTVVDDHKRELHAWAGTGPRRDDAALCVRTEEWQTLADTPPGAIPCFAVAADQLSDVTFPHPVRSWLREALGLRRALIELRADVQPAHFAFTYMNSSSPLRTALADVDCLFVCSREASVALGNVVYEGKQPRLIVEPKGLQDALARATEGATQAPPTVGTSGGFTISL